MPEDAGPRPNFGAKAVVLAPRGGTAWASRATGAPRARLRFARRPAMISFRNVKKSFGDKHVLKGVSFDVQDGEVFFIIGASGVGKSVLIKHLVGLLYPDDGEIWLDGEEISRFDEKRMYPVRMKCAMVFQHSTLFDSMSCAENVALPLRKHRGMKPAVALTEARRLLEQVHMAEFGDRFPAELGDGMRKRVAIARALTLQPRYVLFDEPTTSLDPVSARRVDRLIRELSDTLGVTSIVVSHDLCSIFSIADRIVMLYGGAVRMLGTPAEFKGSNDGIIDQFINGRAEGPMEA
jgi:phospholipid/cholesterol/gamma-HCH transport system ATP-binding protein